MRRCHVSLDVTLISRHCKPMLLLHGEQVEFPAPTKAELGLQNGHSPRSNPLGNDEISKMIVIMVLAANHLS